MEYPHPEFLQSSSKKFVETLAGVQESLALALELRAKDKGRMTPECEAVSYATDALVSFVDSNFVLNAANPRSIRDRDRKKMLPGQHSGVYLQFTIPGDASVLGINFMGGLRILGSRDMRDNDIVGRSSHVQTTDKVLAQPIEVNWQLALPGGPRIDTWIVLNQMNNACSLSSLTINDEKIDIALVINEKDDTNFSKKKSLLSAAMKDLTSTVPSSS